MSEREKVKLVIMTSGEHLIGFVTDEDAESQGEPAIIIDKPVSLVPNPQNPQGGMVFMPYLQFSKEESAPFPKRDIRHVLTPDDKLVEGFVQQFGVGLAVPNGGLTLV